jgi:opacity protein-like surface antigen
VKKLLLAIGFLTIAMSAAISAATSTAWAQAYGFWGPPYGYGAGIYDYSGPYAPAPYAAPPGIYGYDPYGSAYNWDYYRVDRPGRGNNVESTR